ncbi:MAG: hypothetical protein KatS3mg061_3094 [Dehalococcoidia bacterium]|nr:MAG: hypothetical protein KatS3mg061_3094 [Dehalococcoidia bacterium]
MPAVLRLLSFVRPYWRQVVLATLAMVGLAGFSLLVPWLIGRAIDIGLAAGSLTTLVLLAGGRGAQHGAPRAVRLRADLQQ